MGATEIIAAIDALVKLGTFVNNAVGADAGIGKIIAERVAAGRTDWTDAERAAVDDALKASKAYAQQQLNLPNA